MLDILQSRAENRICSFPQITFDLLSEYTEKSREGLLDLNEIIDDDESLPKYKNNESEHIYTLTPLHLQATPQV